MAAKYHGARLSPRSLFATLHSTPSCRPLHLQAHTCAGSADDQQRNDGIGNRQSGFETEKFKFRSVHAARYKIGLRAATRSIRKIDRLTTKEKHHAGSAHPCTVSYTDSNAYPSPASSARSR